jgi:predicted negative regulator of RcsB-dependent stress response
MKSKRRHELQTNELADQLGHWIERVRPHLPTMALVIVGVVVLLSGWYYVASSKEYQMAQAWRAYLYAGTNPQGDIVQEFQTVADDFPESPAGLWAGLMAADVEAGQAVRLLFQEKATAETNLGRAIDTYQKVLASEIVKNQPMVERRAQFGLACALEALGDLDEATEHYEVVAKMDDAPALAEAAQQRLDRLAKEGTREWYRWFADKQPVPRKTPGGSAPGIGLETPQDLETLPEQPTEDFQKAGEAGPEEGGEADASQVDGPQLDGPQTAPAAEDAAGEEAPKTPE